MSAVEKGAKGVDRRNDVLTIVDEKTYIVHFVGDYLTTGALSETHLWGTAQMTRAEAEALLAGLQEALG